METYSLFVHNKHFGYILEDHFWEWSYQYQCDYRNILIDPLARTVSRLSK